MKKRLLSIFLTIVIVLAASAVAYASDPGPGGRPRIIPIPPSNPIECPYE